jgi:hypothetical protein
VAHGTLVRTGWLGRPRRGARYFSLFVAAVALTFSTPGLTTAAASTPSRGLIDAVSWPAAECPTLVSPSALDGTLSQSMNGKFGGCLRVPVVPAGTYYISLQDVLDSKAGPATPTTAKSPGNGTSPGGPSVSLSVSPPSARPGQWVTVTGRLARPLGQRTQYANFCWDGCPNGLTYSGVGLAWPSPTKFSARLVLPAAPWVETGTNPRAWLVSPLPGTYTLAVQCLEIAKGCGLGPPEGQTTVRLRAGAAYTCRSIAGCGRLTANSASVSPGSVVELSGYSPLESVIGAKDPFAFQLTASLTKQVPSGAVIDALHNGVKGLLQLTVGPATVKVVPAVAFSSLGTYRPLTDLTSGLEPISANPAQPGYVGWCGDGFIAVQGPGGTRRAPVKGAIASIMTTGAYQEPALKECNDLALSQNGQYLFAAFDVLPVNQEPMVAEVATFSSNGGRTWSAVPVPTGVKAASFGGFRYEVGGVEALFSAPSPPASSNTPPLVEEMNSGDHWQQVPWACPATGPCITFGAYVLGNCAQGLGDQPVVGSADAGAHWVAAALPGPSGLGQVLPCWPVTLVSLSATTTMLVGSNVLLPSTNPFDVFVTTGMGRPWKVVTLPLLPGQPGAAAPPGPGDVVVLPSGALLAIDQEPWELLTPGTGSWCAVRSGPELAAGQFAVPSSFTAIGNNLWWETSSGSTQTLTVHEVPAQSLSCG